VKGGTTISGSRARSCKLPLASYSSRCSKAECSRRALGLFRDGVDIMRRGPSAAQKMIGHFTPKLVECTDHVLFVICGNGQSFQSLIEVWFLWRR
jgi:hypothetical protein